MNKRTLDRITSDSMKPLVPACVEGRVLHESDGIGTTAIFKGRSYITTHCKHCGIPMSRPVRKAAK